MVQFKKPLTSTTSATDTVAVLCTVQEVDLPNLIASVVDQVGTYRKVSLKVLPGKPTAYPVAGERWVISREYGDWMFIASVGISPSGGGSGPQGPQGPQGAAGPQGATGVPGDTSATPVGSVLMYGGSAAPSGWLLCDGSAISRTTYAALFTAIGTAYGAGDGSSTFNLPSMSAKFARGGDPSPGGGADTHSHTSAAHSHTSAAHSHNLSGNGWAQVAVGANVYINQETISNTYNMRATATGWTATSGAGALNSGAVLDGTTDSATPGSTGSTTPGATGTSSSVPAYTSFNYIIKT